MSNNACVYGLMAEFSDSESLLDAARKTRKAGYKDVQAYTPYWVEGLTDILGKPVNLAPYVVLIGLVLGAFIGFFMQYYTSVYGYPLNVGGRPLNSWPAFILITFELAVLVSGLMVVGALFFQTGLPLPYHPVFNAPNIAEASRSHFFLCIEAKDGRFNPEETKTFLQELGALEVSEVPC